MPLPTAFVVLHLMVWDADSVTLLEKLQPDLAGSFSISGARIEDVGCSVWRRLRPSRLGGASPIRTPSPTSIANGTVPASPHNERVVLSLTT